MPKVGQEPVRRAALVSATIQEIGRARSLDVTVGQIAKSAGMSTALAHYYFDSKSDLFLAAMRHILGEFGSSVRASLRRANTPAGRLAAILQASLGPAQFEQHVVAAWLAFYVEAQRSPRAARLLRIYGRRLHSNLMHELVNLVVRKDAKKIAAAAGAMIDGIYIRHALKNGAGDYRDAARLVRDYIDVMVTHCAVAGAARPGAGR